MSMEVPVFAYFSRLRVKIWCRAPAGTKPGVDTAHVPRSQLGPKSIAILHQCDVYAYLAVNKTDARAGLAVDKGAVPRSPGYRVPRHDTCNARDGAWQVPLESLPDADSWAQLQPAGWQGAGPASVTVGILLGPRSTSGRVHHTRGKAAQIISTAFLQPPDQGTVKVPPLPPNWRQLAPGAAEILPPLATDCRQVWAALLSRCRPLRRPSLPPFPQPSIPQWDRATYPINSVQNIQP
ncbi:hypothetical protein GGX14DRAFT_395478 [Mycena pura]|uniref:Uncharacterized protein n=1 Tax=Mycena pura TaxID=153505 RepID=A0AAD6VEB7_9AGAR|nr:hypothetical protein GGX14DRAFT_395478 [Mycena pura]